MKGWRTWFVVALVLAALLGLVMHRAELGNFALLVRRAEPLWLLLALAFQLSTYASVASGWRLVLAAAGEHRPLPPLMRIAVSKLFADQALPTAGMGGNVLLVDQLRGLGVTRGSAVASLLISLLGFYLAYMVFALATLLLLWVHGQATPLIAGTVTTFMLVAIAIPSTALWLRHRGSAPLPPLINRIRPVRSLLETVAQAPGALINDRKLLLRVALYNALIFLADALTLLACLWSIGEPAHFATAMIALIMASVVVTLGPIPLGLGSFELVCTSMLNLLGVPIEPAFAATLMLRALTLWLPLIPGLFLMRKAMHRHSGPAGAQPPEAHADQA